jgi:hypothetical protein
MASTSAVSGQPSDYAARRRAPSDLGVWAADETSEKASAATSPCRAAGRPPAQLTTHTHDVCARGQLRVRGEGRGEVAAEKGNRVRG